MSAVTTGHKAPVIALVGCPNVGKSTLFNLFTRSRSALVADTPALTRDRQYGEATINDRLYTVIDTGGIRDLNAGCNKGEMDQLVLAQSKTAISEADAVLLVIDSYMGLSGDYLNLAQQLRRQSLKIFVVVNKVDGRDPHQVAADFYPLGLGEVFPITANQRKGIRHLMDAISAHFETETEIEPLAADADYRQQPSTTATEPLATDTDCRQQPSTTATEPLATDADCRQQPSTTAAEPLATDADYRQQPSTTAAEPLATDADYRQRQPKVAIVGRPNVGKSTLINRILGENRVIVSPVPGTTRDSISLPYERMDADHTLKNYTLIDTAGVRRRKNIRSRIEKFSIAKTLKAIAEADVVVLVIDAKEGIVDQDLHLIQQVGIRGVALMLIVNKWDGLSSEHKEAFGNELARRLRFMSYVEVHYISALYGSGVGELYELIDEAYAETIEPLKTNKLNQLLKQAVSQQPPPMVGGHRVKLRYVHSGGQHPVVIIIHGNQVEALPEHYRRYLTSRFRKGLGLQNTVLKLVFKNSDNPFKDRKNRLSRRQLTKRRRLIKFRRTHS